MYKVNQFCKIFVVFFKYKLKSVLSFAVTVTDTGIGIAPEEHIKFLSVFIELKKAATLGVAAQGWGYSEIIRNRSCLS